MEALNRARALLDRIRQTRAKDGDWCDYERDVLAYLEHGQDRARLADKCRQYLALLPLERARPLAELARVFRAQLGDREAQRAVSVGLAELYEPAATFEQFLDANGLSGRLYEEVLR